MLRYRSNYLGSMSLDKVYFGNGSLVQASAFFLPRSRGSDD